MSLCRDIDCGMALTMASCLRRLLESEGVENQNFQNETSVTDMSLHVQELQAVSCYWGMKVVDLPVVAERRLKELSRQLTETVSADICL